MPILFVNKDFNKKYQINAETDQEIRTPDGYVGPLSGIKKEETITGMIERSKGKAQTPLVSLKTAPVVDKKD